MLAYSFATTKPVEDAFQRLRVQEQRGQANQKVALERVWFTLLRTGVLSGVHAFTEINYESVSWKRKVTELPKKVPPSWFKPSSRKPLLPLQRVAGQAQACTLDE
eukprot:3193754-Lingulodinium_polyedra.AAC.1